LKLCDASANSPARLIAHVQRMCCRTKSVLRAPCTSERTIALGTVASIIVFDVRTASHSSHALPAPNPVPKNTGHALRLNSSTENMTPKPAPMVLRMRRVLRQWSHYVAHRQPAALDLSYTTYRRRRTLLQPFIVARTFSFSSASLNGRPARTGGGTTGPLGDVESAMVRPEGL
jgi:hypothetical protein